MSALLAKAIRQLNLKPGQSYRTIVEGHEVKVRRLDIAPSVPADDELSSLADCVMVDLWLNIPLSPAARIVTPVLGPIQLPDPPQIDEWDRTPE